MRDIAVNEKPEIHTEKKSCISCQPRQKKLSILTMFSTAIGRLRIISLVEALSYLILLGIAMPLKYIWGEPLAVKIMGSAHGALFLIFCAALLNAMISEKWSLKPATLIFLASLIPFAPLWVEKWLKKQMEAKGN